jgi:hypothetical protein
VRGCAHQRRHSCGSLSLALSLSLTLPPQHASPAVSTETTKPARAHTHLSLRRRHRGVLLLLRRRRRLLLLLLLQVPAPPRQLGRHRLGRASTSSSLGRASTSSSSRRLLRRARAVERGSARLRRRHVLCRQRLLRVLVLRERERAWSGGVERPLPSNNAPDSTVNPVLSPCSCLCGPPVKPADRGRTGLTRTSLPFTICVAPDCANEVHRHPPHPRSPSQHVTAGASPRLRVWDGRAFFSSTVPHALSGSGTIAEDIHCWWGSAEVASCEPGGRRGEMEALPVRSAPPAAWP